MTDYRRLSVTDPDSDRGGPSFLEIRAPGLSGGSDVVLASGDLQNSGPVETPAGHAYENAKDAELSHKRTFRSVILATLPIFMGYSALNALQRKVKLKIGISDEDYSGSELFSFACSLLYAGNLCFRLLHNVLFACLRPRQRVFLSLALMSCSMMALGVGVFLLGIKSIAIIFIAYGLGGVAIGSFESNVLSCISPLGHGTKTWAVMGLPIGYNIINIGSFALLWATNDSEAVQALMYFLVIAGCAMGAFVFAVVLPRVDVAGNSDTLAAFTKDLKAWRDWFPHVTWNSLALCVNMFSVAMFSSIALYIYDNPGGVPLMGSASDIIISKSMFMMVYNVCTFTGDTVSRKLAYKMKPRNPMIFLLATVIGTFLCLTKIAILSWPGVMLVLFANGGIYASTTKHIDVWVRKDQTLVALSVWLFLGDIGSVTGANVLYKIREWVGVAGCDYCSS